ncbi:BBE domain-containing protein [Acidothermus cellulolyticus]|uniref:BBE domain-containing protein n=1 Tax=Acidothermus cellulolyticus TaxID=28049 RepID=UPI003B75BC7D
MNPEEKRQRLGDRRREIRPYAGRSASGSASIPRRWPTTSCEIRPYAGGSADGSAYPNYVGPPVPDRETAYYGANLQKLIGTAVDPCGVLAFPQAIPWEPVR